MKKFEYLSPFGLCVALAMAPASAQTVAPAVSVTASRLDDASETVLDLHDTLRPHSDASELLRDLSGFNVSRVGGTAGSAFLRGLGGARLPIVVNDAVVDAACNHGMDPATSYLQPDSYDVLTVVKGPNTVQFGPALSGQVRVQRLPPEPGIGSRLRVAVGRGAFDRLDQSAEYTWSGESFWMRAGAVRNDADNYRDGAGRRFQSFYSRHAATLAAGVRLGADTDIEVDIENGDAIAGFPAFHMDGTRFKRSVWGSRLTHRRPGQTLSMLEFSVRWQHVNHLMDDYSYRPVKPVEMVPGVLDQFPTLLMRQDYTGRTARMSARFDIDAATDLLVGTDFRDDEHIGENFRTTRTCFTGTGNCPVSTASLMPFYSLDARTHGVFAELTHRAEALVLRAGVRADRLRTVAGELRNFLGTQVLPGSHDERTEKIYSGFLRAQFRHGEALDSFVALGVAQRAASNLERASFTAFHIDPETNREINMGLNWRTAETHVAMHAFASRIDDFILAEQGIRALNVDVRRYGAEIDARVRIAEGLSGLAGFAWVRADNLTQQVPLAQTSPAELRLGLEYANQTFVASTDVRLVRRQDRVHVGFGNALGADLGETPGFATVRLMLAWRPDPALQLSAGIDNLFARTFAEHISRTGGFQPAGFVQTTRVHEPGRLAWLRARIDF
jgi:iron complex outermembrane receptor protein